MLFAILFIVAFLVGVIIYKFSRNWVSTVLIPMTLFLANTLADTQAKDAWAFTLIFGLPLVFFASLLGAYVVQIRTIEPESEEGVETLKEDLEQD
jgi:TctA family transporter